MQQVCTGAQEILSRYLRDQLQNTQL